MITIPMRKARIIANMTEKEACAAMHITEEKLSAWENGKSVPTWKYVEAMAEAYQIPVDLINFHKESNQPEIARKLTLEEIKSLPFASVIWCAYVTNDSGVIWHTKMPVVIVSPGEDGLLAGADEAGIYEVNVNDNMLDYPRDSFWTLEPDDAMLPGITREEYNEIPGELEKIVCPKLAEAITSRKITFEKICDQAGIDFGHFVNAMTGKEDFTCGELASIARKLNTTVDEIFFNQESNNHVTVYQI